MSADEHPDREAVMDATDTERKARREERQDARREIPDEWVTRATDALRDYWALASGRGVGTNGEARAVIAAVRDDIERAAREEWQRELAAIHEMASLAYQRWDSGDTDARVGKAIAQTLSRVNAARLREGGTR